MKNWNPFWKKAGSLKNTEPPKKHHLEKIPYGTAHYQFQGETCHVYTCIRKTLPHVKDFKEFWKQRGPFAFALTSSEFPPVLLAPEEWIFGNDKVGVLKELMQFAQRKMSLVRTDFQPASPGRLTPEDMIHWRIKPFPEPWNRMDCPAFLPQGYLTKAVLEEALDMAGQNLETKPESAPHTWQSRILEDSELIEDAFFQLVSSSLVQMGYVLLSPGKNRDAHALPLGRYLQEWEEDEQDAGL